MIASGPSPPSPGSGCTIELHDLGGLAGPPRAWPHERPGPSIPNEGNDFPDNRIAFEFTREHFGALGKAALTMKQNSVAPAESKQIGMRNAAPLQTYPVEANNAAMASEHEREGHNILGHAGHAANHDALADASVLMHRSLTAEDNVIADRSMAREDRVVGE